jgi:thiamine-phosphate diphosphorylase
MVTDRGRIGTGWEAKIPARVAIAARAGIDLIQVRESALEGGVLHRLVSRCVAAVAGTRARVVVNDRIDVALAAGAHGVHLPADGPDARRVRTMVPRGFLVGRSVHSVREARDATAGGGLSYLLIGTVFATGSKPGQVPCGQETVARSVVETTVPVLAIGGVTLTRVATVVSAGAAGVAAIGMFADPPDWEVAQKVMEIRRIFDIV